MKNKRLNWFPMIDIQTCTSYGTCADDCNLSVYDKRKVPTSIIINQNTCIDYCHICQIQCPVGAISYVGAKK